VSAEGAKDQSNGGSPLYCMISNTQKA